MAVPRLSHLVGLPSPQMSTPTALRGPCSWGGKAGVLQPTGPAVLLSPASFDSSKYKYKYKGMSTTFTLPGYNMAMDLNGVILGYMHDTALTYVPIDVQRHYINVYVTVLFLHNLSGNNSS